MPIMRAAPMDDGGPYTPRRLSCPLLLLLPQACLGATPPWCCAACAACANGCTTARRARAAPCPAWCMQQPCLPPALASCAGSRCLATLRPPTPHYCGTPSFPFFPPAAHLCCHDSHCGQPTGARPGAAGGGAGGRCAPLPSTPCCCACSEASARWPAAAAPHRTAPHLTAPHCSRQADQGMPGPTRPSWPALHLQAASPPDALDDCLTG